MSITLSKSDGKDATAVVRLQPAVASTTSTQAQARPKLFWDAYHAQDRIIDLLMFVSLSEQSPAAPVDYRDPVAPYMLQEAHFLPQVKRYATVKSVSVPIFVYRYYHKIYFGYHTVSPGTITAAPWNYNAKITGLVREDHKITWKAVYATSVSDTPDILFNSGPMGLYKKGYDFLAGKEIDLFADAAKYGLPQPLTYRGRLWLRPPPGSYTSLSENSEGDYYPFGICQTGVITISATVDGKKAGAITFHIQRYISDND